MKPKILMVGFFPPADGGIVSQLLTTLSSGITQNYEVVPFNIGRPAKRSIINNSGYWVLMNSGLKRAIIALMITIWRMGIFPFILFWHRPILVHIHTAPFLVFWETAYYALITRILRIACNLQFHFSFRHFYESSGFLPRAAMLWIIRRSSVFIVICKEDVTFIAEKSGNRMPCVYLPNFVDVDGFWPLVRQARARIAHKEDIVVLFLGGSEAIRKGFLDLLQAMCTLRTSRLNLHFLFVAVPREEVERRLPAELLSSYEVRSWVAGAAKIEIFARADIFVLPSYGEGMPIGILEAMAASLPVVATRVGGIPDMITDGQEGYLIDPGDHEGLARAISRLAQEPYKRKEMGKRGFEKVQNLYDVRIGIQHLQNLYEELILNPACPISTDTHPPVEKADT
jgi:glycosyltransferase involved in cell wall biosynthesis